MRLLLVLFFLFSLNFAKATSLQKNVEAPLLVTKKKQPLKNDTSAVDLRKFDSKAVDSYAKQKAFKYDDVVPENPSLWERFWAWVWRSIRQILGKKIGGGVINYVLITLAIAITVFVVIKLIGVDFMFFTTKSKKIDVPFEESLENIHEINFDEQIKNAIEDGNYRLVVRLLYLKTLKRLNDQSLITWLPEKTNQTYILEIEDKNYQKQFASLTNQFEYIWYGEFFIDKNNFERIAQDFDQFNQQAI